MLIKDVLTLLTEYNSSKTNTTLAGVGGDKAAGKNYDNILVGKTQAYKPNEYEVKYAKLFPALAEMVRKLKTQAIKGDMVLNGPALVEMQKLLQTYKPKQTTEGDFSLPFGDNVRMKQRGQAFFIGYNEPDALQSAPQDLTKVAPETDITK